MAVRDVVMALLPEVDAWQQRSVVNVLLAHGANANAIDRYGVSALMEAVCVFDRMLKLPAGCIFPGALIASVDMIQALVTGGGDLSEICTVRAKQVIAGTQNDDNDNHEDFFLV